MVEAIGIAILSAFGTSAAVATGVGIAGISLATIVGTTALIGGSLALQALTTPDTRQKVAAQQFSSRQPLPARRRAYGRTQSGGPFVAWDSFGGSFFTGTYLCEGPISGIESYFVDDKRAAIAANALSGIAGIPPWGNAVRLEGRLGTSPQAVSTLLDALPYWTAAYRLDGCAYIAMQAVAPDEERFKKVYPSGSWPATRALFRGALVRNLNDPGQTQDPATWTWSDNSGLCMRDLITHPLWGMKVPPSLIDDASFGAFATLCAQPVTAKDGSTIPRYVLGGMYELTEQPADVLQQMLDTCDGRLFLTPQGKVGIGGGQYVPPEVTLTDPQILSLNIEIGSGKRATFNRLKISFVSPLHDYQVIEGDPWEDLDGQAEAGEILEADFARPWVQNHNQLRRLAKIHTAKSNPLYRITGMVTNRSGLPALFEDTIRLVLTRYGIDAVFTVDRSVAAGDGSTCTFDLTSLDPACYAFDAATEEGIAPPLPNEDASATPPAPPVDLQAVTEARAISGDTNAVFLRLIADPPEREDLRLIGRYRAQGATEWIDMTSEGDSRGVVISDVLADGTAYEAQGAIAGYGKAVQSDWTATDPVLTLATADTLTPGPPTGFVVNGGAGQATYAFTAPNSANFGSAKVYRGPTTNFADAMVVATRNGAPSQAFDGTISGLSAGIHHFWVRAFNRSGFPTDPADLSSTAGPITVTVT